ncbi:MULTISPECIES: DUF5805 domain-containing protein [Halolamina]|uniref:Ribbon-helix-helix protein, copG family n=1 Tax=Halolamina pelagica TaxID=699431 RepID=A0A1I5MLT1_9EURY|nr:MULTISPECIES: DUF5805 domain-containing protein [Halolamina]NHX36061.1 hypothetical protein [Halolamina sp. R1-12]SFP09881.1 hypothetical protein SAMN05216277_101305 [Halolamina pelagica]
MGADADSETVQVKTRVPAHQREAWREAADELGMSQSEFVRTMVQAGRSGFEAADESGGPSNPEQGGSPGADPRGDGLEARVHGTLSADEAVDWEELVDAVLGDFEDRLDRITQESEAIRYSGRKGGYVLDGE